MKKKVFSIIVCFSLVIALFWLSYAASGTQASYFGFNAAGEVYISSEHIDQSGFITLDFTGMDVTVRPIDNDFIYTAYRPSVITGDQVLKDFEGGFGFVRQTGFAKNENMKLEMKKNGFKLVNHKGYGLLFNRICTWPILYQFDRYKGQKPEYYTGFGNKEINIKEFEISWPKNVKIKLIARSFNKLDYMAEDEINKEMEQSGGEFVFEKG